jgi:DNA processing protein
LVPHADGGSTCCIVHDVHNDTPAASARGMLALLAIRGIGPVAANRMARAFASLEQVRDASDAEFNGVLPPAARSAIRAANWDNALGAADDILERAHKSGVTVLSSCEAEYPSWLKQISDAPAVLYVRGTLRSDLRHVACIGTREPSRFGIEVTQRITSIAAGAGWSIVSGLALGVDSLAHAAALQQNAHTVAVLANGLDSIYPRKNAKLAESILAAGGALVSEQPIGVPPLGRNLVQRDRLQSGMSAGTIVMQTDLIGGSMHTVRFTLLQRRLLFAPVPTGMHADEPKSRGIIALATQTGAQLAKLLVAEGDYAQLLKADYATAPVAKGIAGKSDYDSLIRDLEATAANQSQLLRSKVQLGLF